MGHFKECFTIILGYWAPLILLCFQDPFGDITLPFHQMSVNLNFHPRDGNFDYEKIQQRLQKIKQEIDKERPASNDWLL